jgi:hypothetical protein
VRATEGWRRNNRKPECVCLSEGNGMDETKKAKKAKKAKGRRRTKSKRSRATKATRSRRKIPKFQNSTTKGTPPSNPPSPSHTKPKLPRATARESDNEKARRAGDVETCRGHACLQWAKQITEEHADAIFENLNSAWPPANAELLAALIAASDEVVQLAVKEAANRGFKSLTAADFRQHTEPQKLWKFLKNYYRQNRPSQTSSESSEEFDKEIAEIVERFQEKFLEQEQHRKLDDLEDEEARVEHDLWKQLDKVVEVMAAKYKQRQPTEIWEALIEGFRRHPKLAETVDSVPGTVIMEAGEEFRVTSDPYSVWARFGVGRIVFVWARIMKVALVPRKHSFDEAEQRPLHHFRLLKKQGKQVIEHEVVVPGRLVVKGSTYLPAVRFLRDLGARVYMRAGMKKEYGEKILRFLDWESTRLIGKRKSTIGWHKTDDDTDFILRPDRALLPSSARALATIHHDHDDSPKIEYTLDRPLEVGLSLKGSADGWRRTAARYANDSNVVLGVGVMLAAPLLKFANEQPYIYYLYGRQKIGKTAEMQIAQALVGKPWRPGAKKAFGFLLNVTANRIIQRVLLRNDFGAYGDESSTANPKEFAKWPYDIVGGSEKGRWNQDEQAFSTLVLMTGEYTFQKTMSDVGIKVKAGQLARLLNIPAEVKKNNAFESILGDCDDATDAEIAAAVDAESKRIYDETMENYGWAGLEWQQYLVDLQSGPIAAEVTRQKARWRELSETRRVIAKVPAEYASVIGGFALPAAALEMARAAGILPSTWTRETNDAAVCAKLESWADAPIVAERALRKKIVAGIEKGRFISLRDTPAGHVGLHPVDAADLAGDWEASFTGDLIDRERWGFVKIGRRPRICVDRDTFEKLCGGHNQAVEMANRFLKREWLERDAPGLTKNETITAGKTHRCYVLRPSFLLDGEAILHQEREAA